MGHAKRYTSKEDKIETSRSERHHRELLVQELNIDERNREKRLYEAIKECWQVAADMLCEMWRDNPNYFATKDREILEEAVTHVSTEIADEMDMYACSLRE